MTYSDIWIVASFYRHWFLADRADGHTESKWTISIYTSLWSYCNNYRTSMLGSLRLGQSCACSLKWSWLIHAIRLSYSLTCESPSMMPLTRILSCSLHKYKVESLWFDLSIPQDQCNSYVPTIQIAAFSCAAFAKLREFHYVFNVLIIMK